MTTLADRVKIALDETRMLILGAGILLGFQCRGAFADVFEQLPLFSQVADGVALGLMTCTVALLIAPGLYHCIVEHGNDSGSLHRVVTIFADLALLPFGLALGIDVLISTERLVGVSGARVAGIATTLLALSMWYALPRLRRLFTGQRERAETMKKRDEHSNTPLHTKIEQMLTEARVIIPGVQALFGFQLAIILTSGFERLAQAAQIVHGVSLGLMALSVMLLMAPAAYHRIVFAGEDTPEMHRVGSFLITAATVPLALGLAGDVYVVIGKIAGDTAGILAGVAALSLLCGLWYAFPLVVAYLRQSAQSGRGQRARLAG